MLAVAVVLDQTRFAFAALCTPPFHSPSPAHARSAQALGPPAVLQLEVLLPGLD